MSTLDKSESNIGQGLDLPEDVFLRRHTAQEVDVLVDRHGNVLVVHQPFGGQVDSDLEEIEPDGSALKAGAQRIDPSVAFEVGQDGARTLVAEKVGEIVSGLRGVSGARPKGRRHTLDA